MSPRTPALALVAVAALSACASLQRGESLDPATVPEALRDDWELFSHRCSRCHSVSRPLLARVDTADHWAHYVERMRRQPSSGITEEDVPGILRFLTWYSAHRDGAPPAPQPPAPPPPAPPPPAPPPSPPPPVVTPAPPVVQAPVSDGGTP